jgi:hypothetical protein
MTARRNKNLEEKAENNKKCKHTRAAEIEMRAAIFDIRRSTK